MQEEKFYFNQVLTARRRENEKEKLFTSKREARTREKERSSLQGRRGRAYLLKVPCTRLSELLAVASVRVAEQCIEF